MAKKSKFNGEFVLVGDGGKDPAAEEYLFVPEGSSAIVAPKTAANERPNMSNAIKSLSAYLEKPSAKNRLMKMAQFGATVGADPFYGKGATNTNVPLIPRSTTNIGPVTGSSSTDLLRKYTRTPIFGAGGGRSRSVEAPLTDPGPTVSALPGLKPAGNPDPTRRTRTIVEESDTGVGRDTSTLTTREVEDTSPVDGAGGSEVERKPRREDTYNHAQAQAEGRAATAQNEIDRMARTREKLNQVAQGKAIARAANQVNAANTNLSGGQQQANIQNAIPQMQAILAAFKRGGIVGDMGSAKDRLKGLRKAQFGAIAGDSGGFLSALSGLAGLGNQTSQTALDFMTQTGTVNPEVFGHTDPSVIRSLLPGGPTIQQQQLNQSGQQFGAQMGFNRDQLAQSMQIAQMQNELQRMLGMGQIDAQRFGIEQQAETAANRLALEKLLGQREQEMQARQMLMTRAGRQLNAPGGAVLPSMQPMVGRSSI